MTRKITPLEYSKLVRKSLTPADESVAGFCGRISDNAVAVSGKKNWIYVTLSKGGTVVEARNRFAPPAFGMAVILRPIRNNPLHYEIEDVRATSNADFDFVLLQNHAQNHDWRSPDETRVHIRQWRPLRVMPAAAGGVAIDIEAGRYETATSGSGFYAGDTSLSLSAYRPVRGAVWLLIELDNTGSLHYTISANKAALSLLTDADIPERTPGRIWLAAIKIYAGQSSIRDNVRNSDIVDLRMLSSTNSGIAEAPLDAWIYGRSNRAWVRLNEPDVFWPDYAFSRDVFEFDRVSPVGNKIGTSASDHLTLNLTDTPVLQVFGGAQMYFWLRNPSNYKTIVKDRATATLISGAIFIDSTSPIRSYHNAYIVALFVAPVTEVHTFSFRLAGGIKVWFDTTLVVDSWAPADETVERTLTYDASLTIGDAFLIRIEYYNVNIVPLLDCTVDAPGYANWTLGNAEGHYISSGNGTTQDTESELYYYLPAGDFAGKTVPLVMDLNDITTPTGTSITWEFQHGGSDFIPILHGDTILINGSDPFRWRYTLNSTFGDYTPTISSIAFDIAAHVSDAGVQSVVAGTNITVDNTDPANPVVSSTAGGGDMTKAVYDTNDDGIVNGADTIPGKELALDEWHIIHTDGVNLEIHCPYFFFPGDDAPQQTQYATLLPPVSGAEWVGVYYKDKADGMSIVRGANQVNKAALDETNFPDFGLYFPVCAVKVEAGQTVIVDSDIWLLTRSNGQMDSKPFRVIPSVVNNIVTFSTVTGDQQDSGEALADLLHADGSVVADHIDFDTTPSGTFAVGRLVWNVEEETLDLGMPNDITQQIGHELFFSVKNSSGATITDGTPVMFAGTDGNGGHILIQKAIANGTVRDEATIGLMTHEITNGSFGKATWFGKVRGIDTTGDPFSETWADGDLIWVSQTTAGYLTNVEPATGQKILIAAVVYSANNGVLLIRPTWGNYLPFQIATDTNFTTGVVDRSLSTLSLSTRTLTIAPTGDDFDIYSAGVKFVKTGDASCETTIADTVGLHFVYFDATGTLQNSMTPWDIEGTGIPIATIYWNGSAGAVGDERHSAKRNNAWHAWAHDTIGTRYENGLGQTYPTTANDGLTQIETGHIHDEDIDVTTGQQKVVRLWYETASNVWTWANGTDNGGYDRPYIWNAGTSRVQYPKSNSAYALTDVGASDFVVQWVYASTDKDRPIYIVTRSATAPHNTIGNARTETTPVVIGVLSPEMKLIYRWIYKGDGQYQEGSDYRTSSSLPGGATATVPASQISFAPAGGIAAANVQAAIEELDTEKVPTTRTLTGTAPITIAGSNSAQDLSADRTIAIVAATALVPGSMSAADKAKLDLVDYGTYTPTLNNVTNVASSTALLCQYMRVGNVVTVGGAVTIDPTATGALELGMSLPIASNFANNWECGGTCCNQTTASNVGAILADAPNNRARVMMNAVDAASRNYFFSYTYLIV